MTFLATMVKDWLSGEPDIKNPRASTLSIYDQDIVKLKQQTGTNVLYIDEGGGIYRVEGVDRLFTVNRFTMDAAHQFLIPRAVAYSAGLINHFFRGKLEISRPDQAFFFDMDSLKEIEPEKKAYTRLNLKVSNRTPDIETPAERLPQPMNGSLEVVVRYHEAGSEEEKVSRSATPEKPPLPVSLPAQSEPVEFGFEINPPVPVEATQINLYLIYRGTLGQEANAIVVSRREIDETPFKLDLSLPEEGVYALVDHAVVKEADEGFPLFKFRLKITPARGEVTEAMDGELKLAAEFLQNRCYAPDLSGEYNSSGLHWNGCSLPLEYPIERIESSQLTTIHAPDYTKEKQAETPALLFPFPQPIPLSATDLMLKLEYAFSIFHSNGVEEKVTMKRPKDISEPTYLSADNTTDYILVDQQYYTQDEIMNN
jgi:hypothetical protein